MRHLQPDELIDVAEGTRTEAAEPHLRACARCREQLADLRAMLSAAADADVWIKVEHRLAREIDVSRDERPRQVERREAVPNRLVNGERMRVVLERLEEQLESSCGLAGR